MHSHLHRQPSTCDPVGCMLIKGLNRACVLLSLACCSGMRATLTEKNRKGESMSNGWKKEELKKYFQGEVGDSGWSASGRFLT